MKFSKDSLKLYALTDRRYHPELSLEEQVRKAIMGGATCIQLREKDLDHETFLEEARKLVKLCHNYEVPLIINDDLDIALAVKADGVHLGQDDMDIQSARAKAGPDFIIGISAHNVKEAKLAEKNSADYLGSGAVFGTKTKPDVTPLSLDTLKEITASVNIPVVAIGGITRENLPRLQGSGIAGPALVSAVFDTEDIEANCKELTSLIEKILD